MELNEGSRAEAAVSSPPCKINEYLSHRFAKRLPSLLALMRRYIAHKCKEGAKIKIIIFSIKFDKFTRYFDKFLKRINPVNDCYKTGYYINMSDVHSDSAPKKVFSLTRISPQLPAFPLAPHDTANPPYSVGFDPRISPQLPAFAHEGESAREAGEDAQEPPLQSPEARTS